jgi:hypothetical protein
MDEMEWEIQHLKTLSYPQHLAFVSINHGINYPREYVTVNGIEDQVTSPMDIEEGPL